MATNEHEIAQQSQEKFQFYVIALVFTVLGFALQNPIPSGYPLSKAFELLSWFSLLISGLAGLSHLEWSPVIRIKMANKDDLELKTADFKQKESAGVKDLDLIYEKRIIPIEVRIAEYEDYISKLNSLITQLEKKAEFKYQVFKCGFALGLFFLTISRAGVSFIEATKLLVSL